MFSKQLKLLRDLNKKSQQEVCSALNIEQSTLANYENGRRVPKTEILIKIAEYYNCSVDFLLGIDKLGKIDYSNYQIVSPEFANNIKDRIQALIAEQNISKDEFAKKTKFNIDDTKMPSIENLIKIANDLNVSADYLLGNSKRKRITAEEEKLLEKFNNCDDKCKKYLIDKAGVLSVEGISAVSSDEHEKYADKEKKSFSSNGIEEKRA